MMVFVMTADATPADVQAVIDLVESAGGEAFVSVGVSRVIIGLVGDVDQFAALNLSGLSGLSGLRDVTRISAKYKGCGFSGGAGRGSSRGPGRARGAGCAGRARLGG